MRSLVILDDGDVAAIVFDDEVDRLEIYDEDPDSDGEPLDQEIGTPLIQAQLSDEAREALIRALGGVPLEEA